MALRVVGAGLGRTGTASLQLALQQLLDGRCYHMGETFGRPDDIPVWHAAVNGSSPDWDAFLRRIRRHRRLAGVRVLVASWPRPTPTQSCSCRPGRAPTPGGRAPTTRSSQIIDERHPGGRTTGVRCTDRDGDGHVRHGSRPDWQDETAAKRAYEEHNAAVRATIDPARLVEWQPGDGWEPLCAALGVAGARRRRSRM